MRAKKSINNGNCFIIVKHTYRNYLDELHDYAENINSVHQFENMLRWAPEKAEALGYPGEYHDKRHFNPRVSNVKLAISIAGVETPLKDIYELTSVLDSNPEVGDKLQYK